MKTLKLISKISLKIQQNNSMKLAGENKIKFDLASNNIDDYKRNIEEVFLAISNKKFPSVFKSFLLLFSETFLHESLRADICLATSKETSQSFVIPRLLFDITDGTPLSESSRIHT